MIRQNPRGKGSRYTTQKALKSLDKTADRLLCNNIDCLIPETESIGHGVMNNCHIIAEGFLDLISKKEGKSKKGQVLCWPISTRSMGREAHRAISRGQFDRDSLSILPEKYEPVHRSKNHRDVKLTFACRNHDDKVFKPLDSVQEFNIEDKETQFKLALRTMAAYTAWYRGHKIWTQADLKKDQFIHGNLKDYPELQPAYDVTSEWGEDKQAVERMVEREMERWQGAYLRSAWDNLSSEYREVRPVLRIAGTGVTRSLGCHVVMTFLPTIEGKCLVIATVLKYKMLPLLPRIAAKRVANLWAKRLSELNPIEWLPMLSQESEFLYLSPDDYYNDEIMTSEERSKIEEAMAQKMNSLRIGDVKTRRIG